MCKDTIRNEKIKYSNTIGWRWACLNPNILFVGGVEL